MSDNALADIFGAVATALTVASPLLPAPASEVLAAAARGMYLCQNFAKAGLNPKDELERLISASSVTGRVELDWSERLRRKREAKQKP